MRVRVCAGGDLISSCALLATRLPDTLSLLLEHVQRAETRETEKRGKLKLLRDVKDAKGVFVSV